MKNNLVIIPAVVAFLFSCSNRSKTEVKDILPSAEILGKDTINKIDFKGMKQGHWINFEVGPTNTGASVTRTADSSQNNASWQSSSGRTKTGEGFYKDDKKTGYWKTFKQDGSIKDSTEFK